MRTKFNKLVIAVVIAASLCLLAPYFIGLYIEKNYDKLYTKVSNNHFHIHIINYNRGWFSSRATVEFTIKPFPNSLKDYSSGQSVIHFTINTKIYHSIIVPYINESGRHWAIALASFIKKNKPEQADSSFIISSLWKLTQHSLYFHTQHYQATKDYMTFSVEHLTGHLYLKVPNSRPTGIITIGNATINYNSNNNTKTNTINLQHLTFSITPDLWLPHSGTTNLNINKINSMTKYKGHPYGDDRLLVKNLTLTSNQRNYNDKLNLDTTINSDTVSYGPLTIKNLAAHQSIRNIDTAYATQLQSMIQRASLEKISNEALFNTGLKLLSKGIDYKLQTQFDSTDGLTKIHINTLIHPFSDYKKPQVLLKNLHINADILLPKALLFTAIKANYAITTAFVGAITGFADILVSPFKNTKKPSKMLTATEAANNTINYWQKNKMIIAADNSAFQSNIKFDGNTLRINGHLPKL